MNNSARYISEENQSTSSLMYLKTYRLTLVDSPAMPGINLTADMNFSSYFFLEIPYINASLLNPLHINHTQSLPSLCFAVLSLKSMVSHFLKPSTFIHKDTF